MLRGNPKMLSRLDDLEADLLSRRSRALIEGWAGEIEGLDLTLQLLRTKREDSRRRPLRPLVDLGLPGLRAKTEGQWERAFTKRLRVPRIFGQEDEQY